MRRITFAVVSTIAVLILLFSYPTSTNQTPATPLSDSAAHIVTGPPVTTSGPPEPSTPSASNGSTGRPTANDSTSAQKTATGTTSAAPGTRSADGAPMVVDGASVMTRYGPVQVEVTITGGRIIDVKALAYPTQDRRDQQINSRAIPLLHDQVISAQSAQIDGVSGATFTTEGYVSSLQSALDAANFR
jgi:uncharacterized protein with FMN-binding domain